MEDESNGDIIIYDMNNHGVFQCLAIAKNEKALEELKKMNYVPLFTPDRHGINCWILFLDDEK